MLLCMHVVDFDIYKLLCKFHFYRGVLARAIMQAQGASPTFTRVYAALVAIINTKVIFMYFILI